MNKEILYIYLNRKKAVVQKMGGHVTTENKSTYGTDFSSYDTKGLQKHPTIKLVHDEKKEVDLILIIDNINAPLLQAVF